MRRTARCYIPSGKAKIRAAMSKAPVSYPYEAKPQPETTETPEAAAACSRREF